MAPFFSQALRVRAPRRGVPPCLSVRYGAIDLGATSGRVVAGRLDGGRVALEEVAPVPEPPGALPDGLRWNLLHLFTEALEGLRARRPRSTASASTPGASTTRCSTSGGRVLGLPFHYRDSRTEGMIERAFARVSQPTSCTPSPASRRCRSTPSSSCSPTRARRRWPPPSAIALVPDLLAFWLSGELANESHERVDDRAARRARAAAGRSTSIDAARPAPPALRPARRAGHAARPAARPPRARRRAGLRRRRPRHRVGVRRRAGARRARRDPVERHLVACSGSSCPRRC